MKKIITSIFVLGFVLCATSVFADHALDGLDISKLSPEQEQELDDAINTYDQKKVDAVIESFHIDRSLEKKSKDHHGAIDHKDEKEHMGMPILTAEQKAKLKEVRASGDKEAVVLAMKEFGIDMPSKEEMEKKMAEHKTQMEAVKTAIDAGDYTAYQAAVVGTVMADKVDSATFEILVKAHDLRAAGDTAGAVALVKGLGMDVMHKEFTKKFVRQNLEAADKELVKQAKELMKSGDAVAAQEIFSSLKDKYEVELAQPIKKFSLFGWLKQKRN